MKFDKKTGTLEINEKIKIFKKMRRNHLTEKDFGWEEWIKIDNEVMAYRIVINSKETKNYEIIIICYFEKSNGPIRFFDFGPAKIMNGRQSKPEGKYTKKMRIWFLENLKISIPIKEPWGEIDAFYDPHNLTTSAICTYN